MNDSTVPPVARALRNEYINQWRDALLKTAWRVWDIKANIYSVSCVLSHSEPKNELRSKPLGIWHWQKHGDGGRWALERKSRIFVAVLSWALQATGVWAPTGPLTIRPDAWYTWGPHIYGSEKGNRYTDSVPGLRKGVHSIRIIYQAYGRLILE